MKKTFYISILFLISVCYSGNIYDNQYRVSFFNAEDELLFTESIELSDKGCSFLKNIEEFCQIKDFDFSFSYLTIKGGDVKDSIPLVSPIESAYRGPRFIPLTSGGKLDPNQRLCLDSKGIFLFN